MSCPKNIIKKKFLIWKWEKEGPHHMVIDLITKFLSHSTDFTVEAHCKICGARKSRHFVEVEELMREGHDVQLLERGSSVMFYPEEAKPSTAIFNR